MKFVKLSTCFLFVVSTTAIAADVATQKEQQNLSADVAIQEEKTSVHLNSMDVINILVKEGVITKQRAEELIQSVAAEKISDDIEEHKQDSENDTKLDAKIVRVPYIPDFVSKQIRDEVRLSLREEVVTDVIGQAKHERWGVPDALPGWVNRISFKGDFRLRYQGDIFSDLNAIPDNIYFDPQAVNDARSFSPDQSFFHNITEDEHRLRARLRLAMNAKVTEGVKVGMRIATGSKNNPASTNKTLGSSFRPYELVLDRAFIKMQSEIKDHTFIGGRMPNPWISTDLLWDSDLNFDGLAYKYRPLQSDDMFDEDRIFDTFVTFGAFPLDEVALSSDDKWLFGFQSGLNWSFDNQDRLDIVISYYDYTNIEGEKNSPDSNLLDYTSADLLGSGNTLFNIANSLSDPDDTLLALASDYNIVNFLVKYNISKFAPVNIDLTMDYVKNVGYKQADVLERSGGSGGLIGVYGNSNGEAKDTGYQFKLDIGWPTLNKRGNWKTSIAYKYLERDAVIDIFTDSDFRGGGTDVQGYILQGSYAFDDNTWTTFKLISADEIDGAPYGRETVQFDLNATF